MDGQYVERPIESVHDSAIELAALLGLKPKSSPSVRYGWDTTAILFDELVVRIPRNYYAWLKMQKEEQVLAYIGGHLPVTVPAPKTLTEPYSLSYHEMVRGVTLSQSALRRMSRRHKDYLAGQLVEVFIATQQISPHGFSFEIPHSAPAMTLLDMRNQIRQEPRWRDILIVVEVLQRVFDQWANSGEVDVFGHFDMNGSNILIDPESGSLAGILDFLDCGVGSRFYDVSKISKIDFNFSKNVWDEYSRRLQLDGNYFQLVAAYGSLEQLSDIMHPGTTKLRVERKIARVYELLSSLD